MSSVVTIFDPSTNQNAQFTAPSSSANGALVFFNESNISLILTFADSSTMYLPAWYHRHKCGTSGSVNIVWDIHQVLSSGSPPISQIIVESFAQGEAFPADGPLMRQANIGNNVPLSGSTTAIINDGNTAGTSVIEATVIGDPGSAVTQDNAGNLVEGNATRAGSLTIWGPASVNGNAFLVSSNGHVTIPAQVLANLITSIVPTNAAGNDLGLHVQNTFHVIVTVIGVGNILSVGAEGVNVLSGKLSLPFGQAVSAISHFGPYTSATSPTAFNHNLGAIPDIVIVQTSGGVTTSRTTNVDYNTFTSTTFNADSNIAGFSFYGIALKF